MKFTIDTKNKKIVLEEAATFEEIESLKKFIGKGWEKWTMAKTAGEIVHHYDNWRYYRPWTWGGGASLVADNAVLAYNANNNAMPKGHQADLSNLCVSGDKSAGIFALNCEAQNLNAGSLKMLNDMAVLK